MKTHVEEVHIRLGEEVSAYRQGILALVGMGHAW